MHRLATALSLALSVALNFSPVRAEEPNLSANPANTFGAASRLATAQRAYLHALENGEVLALVVAIRLARSVTLRPANAWERADPDPMNPQLPADFPDPASDVALAIARNLAADDPLLQDLVYDLDAQLPRARLETAVTTSGNLAPGQSATWRIALFGEVGTELALISDGRSKLSLTLTDDADNILCAVPPSSRPALCRLTPARNGFFALRLKNDGQAAADYRLFGN
ncbi:hypothetical protein [Tabrizicola sp.]|uniref:hypothetical protein n=1 Tax=Tabrizicola sp. TaxID=2005166 RepID=UPI00263910EB|nr:hypothetical protein [Tabrizicola sp.]MDM7933290.1 hypothetical protein [Tabrizicola sp.]